MAFKSSSCCFEWHLGHWERPSHPLHMHPARLAGRAALHGLCSHQHGAQQPQGRSGNGWGEDHLPAIARCTTGAPLAARQGNAAAARARSRDLRGRAWAGGPSPCLPSTGVAAACIIVPLTLLVDLVQAQALAAPETS